jgi:hypothetical protein
MENTIEKTIARIKRLEDLDVVEINPSPAYVSDEWGMNRFLSTENDGTLTVSDLKAIVEELEILRANSSK